MTNDDTKTICGLSDCDRPANGFFICYDCAGKLLKTMETIGWMLSELELVIALQTRYTTTDHHGSSDPAAMDFVAAQTRDRLSHALTTLAVAISQTNGWTNPTNAAEAASVIHWRITAVRLYPNGPVLVDRLNRAIRSAMYVIDRPVSRQYLGNCESLKPKPGKPCPGRVYGREWRTWAQCDTCGLRWNAAELQAYLIAELADRLCTASEIAHLSTYLDLTLTRNQIRKRVNSWHHRGTLPASGTRDGQPLFRFGAAHTLLSRFSTTHQASA